MATLHLNTLSDDSQPDDQNPKDPDEVMKQPWLDDLANCRPKIEHQSNHRVLTEDGKILEELHKECEGLSAQLQKSITVQLKVGEIYADTKLCVQRIVSEDLWSYLSVWPILRLARELSGLKGTVQALPLMMATISPLNLLPQWKGTMVSRKIDFWLAIKLEDDIDITKYTQNSSYQKDDEDSGIGPAAGVPILKDHPLFCHIEVKKQDQVVDPIVQLGVWTSAVYTRWEQVKEVNSSSRDFPISFIWTVKGSVWLLHTVRRLPDGSRRITETSQSYTTKSLPDIYLIIATLYRLIHYGHKEFREQFLDSVLGIQAQGHV